MNLKEKLNNKIIICFKENKPIFLNLKREDPTLNFKLLDVNEVIERLSFIHDFKALVEIIKIKKVSLKSAKQILNCMKFVGRSDEVDELKLRKEKLIEDSSKEAIHECELIDLKINLITLKEELFSKGLLVEKELRKYILMQNEIILFNQQNNKELQGILRKNGLNFTNLTPQEIGIDYTKQLKLIKYKDRFEQLNVVCNEICNLLNSGVNPEEIAIRTHYDDLKFYFNIFEDLYHLKFYYKSQKNLRVYSSVQDLLNQIDSNKSFDIEIEPKDDKISAVLDLINNFELKKYDFEFARNLLNDLLDSYKESEISKVGVMVTKDFNCDNKKYVFELDFNFDNYPSVSSDDGYYIDEQVDYFGLNPSYIKTQIDNDKKQLFLFYVNPILSVTVINFSQEVFMSTYIKQFNIEQEDYIKAKVMNNSSIASKLTYKIHKNNFKNSDVSKKLDDLFKNAYSIDEEYDHSFKHFVDEKNVITESSYSHINKFYECPFKFYCDRVLRLTKSASSQAIDIGHFMHEILESVFEKEFDFEKTFESAVNSKEYNYDESTKVFYRTVIKDYALMITNFIRDRFTHGNYIKTYSEKDEKITVADIEIKGTIDSILVSEYKNETFLTIIDYKTGTASFDIASARDGIGLQLPIYSLFLSKDDEFKKDKLGGLFIQPIFNLNSATKGNVLNKSKILSGLKLNGVWETDQEYLRSIDNTINEEKPITSSFFSGKKSPATSIKDVKDCAEEKIKEFADATKSFLYDILPYKFEGSNDVLNGCEYCSFRNVCYRNGRNFRNVRKAGK